MATYKSVQESLSSLPQSQLRCDICGSLDIADTREGYACRDCGIVLEIQKLQYDRPYNEDLIQHARRLSTTQIGTKRERGSSPESRKLHRLNKQNSIIENDKKVLSDAEKEISRIFTCLDLAEHDSVKMTVLEKFKIVREKFRSGSKYRNVEKLCTVISYMSLKLMNVSVNPYKLIEYSKLTRREFNKFLLQMQRYLSDYTNRNRQKYILQRTLEICEHFDLGMPFYYLAKKILHKLWDGIKNTTDNAVAGLISSISALCSCKDKVSVSAICNRLGIRMSTVQAQVKKKVFERFKVNGFISLIKSSDMLVKVMEKLGLLDEGEIEEASEVVEDGRVEIVLGNTNQIFNASNVDHYYFAIRGEKATPIIITLKIYGSPLELGPETRQRFNPAACSILSCIDFLDREDLLQLELDRTLYSRIKLIFFSFFLLLFIHCYLQRCNGIYFLFKYFQRPMMSSGNNFELINSVLDEKISDYNALGYFPQVHKPSLQATYYGLYVLKTIGKLHVINQTKMIDFIIDHHDPASGLFIDTLASRYLDMDFSQAYYPLSSLLEVNCYAVLSLDILNSLDLIDTQEMKSFIWDFQDPITNGFIGQPHEEGLEDGFKVSTADNTYFAVITLDLLMDDWAGHASPCNT